MLLTRTSTPGSAWMSFAQPAAFATSLATPDTFALGCALRILATAASTRSWVLPFTTTDAPSAANALAVAKPIPAVEPVTNTFLPASCKSMNPSFHPQQGSFSPRFIFDASAELFRKIAHFGARYRPCRAPPTSVIFRRDRLFSGQIAGNAEVSED